MITLTLLEKLHVDPNHSEEDTHKDNNFHMYEDILQADPVLLAVYLFLILVILVER